MSFFPSFVNETEKFLCGENFFVCSFETISEIFFWQMNWTEFQEEDIIECNNSNGMKWLWFTFVIIQANGVDLEVYINWVQ